MPGQFARVLPQFILVAAADDQDLDVTEPLRQRRQCTQQYLHALAGLVEAAEEQYRLARPRIAVEHWRVRERADIDAIGDFDGVAAQRLHLPSARQIRHRDATDDLLV